MLSRRSLLSFLLAAMVARTWVAPLAAQVGAPPAGAPRLIHKVEPEYTPEAREASISGIVVVSIVVRADGSVDSAKVVRGLGYGLDEKAIECVNNGSSHLVRKKGSPSTLRLTSS